MCGFSGYISKQKLDKKVIKDMGDIINHRGPDEETYLIDDKINVAFRRLSIIDLNSGSQPIFYGNKAIIYNGEIYNYREIREDLVNKGYSFKTKTDTEVVLIGYEEYGEKILDHLRGMFAFIIWDKDNEELFAARDIFGIKPFYYYQNDDVFMFSSEIKSFLVNPLFKKELNRESLKTYLTFQYSALDETFFKNVYRLKPGHFLKYKDGKLTIKKYFNFEYDVQKRRLEETIDAIRNQVSSSVEYHKISDVTVGAFLSGGIDSSYIVALMHPDNTYSVGFDFEGFNETNDSERLSKLLKVNNKKKLITSDEFLEGVKKVQYYSDEPHANLSSVPLYYLANLASKDVKVVLSGEGADELFAGYDPYNPSKLLINYRKLPNGLRKAIRKLALKLPNIKGKHFLVTGGLNLEEDYIGHAFIYDDEGANKMLQDEYKTNIKYTDITRPYFDKVKGLDDVTRMQYVDMNLWLPLDILLKADKMTMANSLELRVPYLDKEVFKESLKLSRLEKISKNRIGKYALRKASEKYIPEEWASRKKIGFLVPFVKWLKDEKVFNEVKKVFKYEYADKFFKREELDKLLNDHEKGIVNNTRKIYTIYCFLLWYKIYFVDFSY